MHSWCSPFHTPQPKRARPGATHSVYGLSDWQLRFLGAGEGPPSPPFWWQPATLDLLRQQGQGLGSRPVVLQHQPSGRTVWLMLQELHFTVGEQISPTAGAKGQRLGLRHRLLAPFRSRVLCLGQLLASGAYGQLGLGDLPPPEAAHLLRAVVATLLRLNPWYRGVLLKDLMVTDSPVVGTLERQGYTKLPTDPVMELSLPFGDREAYLAALTSKYRVRYRRARSKLGDLSRRRLGAAEVSDRLPRIYELYRVTARGAAVNFVDLQPDYFRWLAAHAVVHGYFDGLRLIGFTTGLPDGKRYLAHYLGMEERYKQSHHLYHNMLFDLLDDALTGAYHHLDLGRTALAIKSSLGAVPHAYATLLRLPNPLLNYLVPHFVPAVFTPEPWTPRQPFRR